MSAGGSSGPTRGGYFQVLFATALVGTAPTSAGITVGSWSIPTGARFEVIEVDAWCGFSGSSGAAAGVGRVNVLQGSTSVLSSEISLATATNTKGTLTAGIVPVESAVVLTATANQGAVGSVAGQPQAVQVRVTGFLSRHPNSIFGNFGTANPTSQPTFGP